jgi:putative transcriptional regulator
MTDRRSVKVIDAVRLLVGSGVGMLKAKRAIETMLSHGEIAMHLPAVDGLTKLAKKLRNAGVNVNKLASDTVDVRALRVRLDMTREQFAIRYNLPLDSVTKWELQERQPDRAANNYLRVIASEPEVAALSQLQDVD